MIGLDTKINEIGRDPTVRIAHMALRWCKRKFGINKRKKYQPVWYVRRSDVPDICGEYDDEHNEVLVYWDQCEDVKEVIQTCIHEWTHQLQPITTKYYKYPGSYSRNPFERQARYKEKKYTPIFWDEYKDKINKVK